jgi:hypothetical protein
MHSEQLCGFLATVIGFSSILRMEMETLKHIEAMIHDGGYHQPNQYFTGYPQNINYKWPCSIANC